MAVIVNITALVFVTFQLFEAAIKRQMINSIPEIMKIPIIGIIMAKHPNSSQVPLI